MVDKIDRSEAPPAYFITRPKDAKESQHENKERGDEEGERRQKEQAELEWSKFDRRTTAIRPLKASRAEISRCLFRGVFLHSGVGTLQIDVIWRDGRRTLGALVLLPRLEDYLRLKKFAAGQDVPDAFWSRNGAVELGIISAISPGQQQSRGIPSGESHAVQTRRRGGSLFAAMGAVDRSGRINWGVVAIYSFFFVLAVFIVVSILRA